MRWHRWHLPQAVVLAILLYFYSVAFVHLNRGARPALLPGSAPGGDRRSAFSPTTALARPSRCYSAPLVLREQASHACAAATGPKRRPPPLLQPPRVLLLPQLQPDTSLGQGSRLGQAARRHEGGCGRSQAGAACGTCQPPETVAQPLEPCFCPAPLSSRPLLCSLASAWRARRPVRAWATRLWTTASSSRPLKATCWRQVGWGRGCTGAQDAVVPCIQCCQVSQATPALPAALPGQTCRCARRLLRSSAASRAAQGGRLLCRARGVAVGCSGPPVSLQQPTGAVLVCSWQRAAAWLMVCPVPCAGP